MRWGRPTVWPRPATLPESGKTSGDIAFPLPLSLFTLTYSVCFVFALRSLIGGGCAAPSCLRYLSLLTCRSLISCCCAAPFRVIYSYVTRSLCVSVGVGGVDAIAAAVVVRVAAASNTRINFQASHQYIVPRA